MRWKSGWRRKATRKWSKEWRKSPEGKRSCRDTQLKIKFGISLEEYEKILNEQKGLCAICGETCPSGRNLAVDHDHETGKVRGLLCIPCNTSVGLMKTEEKMIKMIEYVRRAKKSMAQQDGNHEVETP